MDYSITAKELLKELGGEKNIKSVTHCATRLRFNLNDDNAANDDNVKAIKGVMGVMKKGGQYQVIIGSAVANCYTEFVKLGSFSDSTASDSKTKKKFTIGGLFNSLLDTISGCMAPILPALMVAGMVKLLIIVLGLFGIDNSSQTMQILTIVGDSGIYYMPMLLAYSAAKKFGSNPAIAVAIMGVLIYPDFMTMLGGAESVSFLGLPVYPTTYSSCVIPPILIAYVLKWVDKLIDKITPSWTKTVFKPMLVMLIMAPVAFCVLGPIGAIVGNGLAAGIGWLQETCGWLTLMIGGALMPLLVMTGMHYAFLPSAIQSITNTPGYDLFLLPGMLCSNIAQGAACLAVAIKSKNKELKSVAVASAAGALFGGITEPAMYGVTIKLKKPMIAACIGGGAAGLVAGIFQLKEYAVVSPSVIGSIGFIGGEGMFNFIIAIIAMVISFVVTFILTLVLKFKDPENPNEENKKRENEVVETTATVKTTEITSPINGILKPLSEVDDETFATGILGDGVAIIPCDNKVYAPFDGKVDTLFNTLHAMGLVSDDGVEMLIHIGLETVKLEGKGFTPHIKSGDSFKKGDLLMEFDIDFIKSEGFDISTPVIVSNSADYPNMTVIEPQEVTTATPVISLG